MRDAKELIREQEQIILDLHLQLTEMKSAKVQRLRKAKAGANEQ
jgi:hypothetical protein